MDDINLVLILSASRSGRLRRLDTNQFRNPEPPDSHQLSLTADVTDRLHCRFPEIRGVFQSLEYTDAGR